MARFCENIDRTSEYYTENATPNSYLEYHYLIRFQS